MTEGMSTTHTTLIVRTLERDIARVLERVVAFSSDESRLDCSERGESGQIYHSYNPITVTSHDQRRVAVIDIKSEGILTTLHGRQFRQVYSSFSLL